VSLRSNEDDFLKWIEMDQRLLDDHVKYARPERRGRPPGPVTTLKAKLPSSHAVHPPGNSDGERNAASEGSWAFGHLLRAFRMALNLSQEALAERAGLSAGGISALERGARRVPYRNTLALLTSALGLSTEDRERLQAAAVRTPAPRRRGLRPAYDGQIEDHEAPLSLTSFHGREEARATSVRSSEQRLVTLIGPGGLGKTPRAVEPDQAVVERSPDGVWYVEATFEIVVRYDAAETSTATVAQLVNKRFLIALENGEHVEGAVAAITQQLAKPLSQAARSREQP
jgi:transcriptional regulator with XRE-family HTH domain